MSDADLQRIALQARADEHHDAAAAQARVEDFVGTQAPAAVPQTPEEEAAAQEKAQSAALEAMVKAQLPRVCAVLWGIIDTAAVKFAGPEYALSPSERADLAEATAPVVLKYIPKDLAFLANTPEGALILTAAVIYGAKVMTADKPKPGQLGAPPAVDPTPTTLHQPAPVTA